MKRIKHHVMQIAASPAVVFPLLCPVREADWIDGWSCEMLHSESGLAELGCVFKTNRAPENEAFWIMTRCDSPREAEYVRFVTGKMFVVLRFQLAALRPIDIALKHRVLHPLPVPAANFSNLCKPPSAFRSFGFYVISNKQQHLVTSTKTPDKRPNRRVWFGRAARPAHTAPTPTPASLQETDA